MNVFLKYRYNPAGPTRDYVDYRFLREMVEDFLTTFDEVGQNEYWEYVNEALAKRVWEQTPVQGVSSQLQVLGWSGGNAGSRFSTVTLGNIEPVAYPVDFGHCDGEIASGSCGIIDPDTPRAERLPFPGAHCVEAQYFDNPYPVCPLHAPQQHHAPAGPAGPPGPPGGDGQDRGPLIAIIILQLIMMLWMGAVTVHIFRRAPLAGGAPGVEISGGGGTVRHSHANPLLVGVQTGASA